jgi:hypothetical protein
MSREKRGLKIVILANRIFLCLKSLYEIFGLKDNKDFQNATSPVRL